MTEATWVFGYGSLVSPESMARTVGRAVHSHEGWLSARLEGFGRRWNYGSVHQRGDWHGPDGFVESGVVVCLGIEAAGDERCNGVVVSVTDDELAALDWRERGYDRTDVTDRVVVDDGAAQGRIITYVPRVSTVERYVRARDAGRAAIRRTYHELVDQAFASLGHEHLDEYRTTTPAPEVPIVDLV